jgi:WD40 repeat protein
MSEQLLIWQVDALLYYSFVLIYIYSILWQLSTGKLVASLRRHYQNVSDVKFTGDSSRFISAGGLVLLWSLDTVLHTKVRLGTVFPD